MVTVKVATWVLVDGCREEGKQSLGPGSSNLANEVLQNRACVMPPMAPSVNKGQELDMDHSRMSGTRHSSRTSKSLVAGAKSGGSILCLRVGEWGRMCLTAP